MHRTRTQFNVNISTSTIFTTKYLHFPHISYLSIQNLISYLVNQVDALFNLSRLTEHEFLHIWNIIDIRIQKQLNKEQFIYFLHILNSRRRGRAIPTGVPLHIKERFLSDVRYFSPLFLCTVHRH